MLSWADKLETYFMDSHRSLDHRKEGLTWFRRVARSEEPANSEGPSIDQIIADLLAIGNGAFAGPIPLQAHDRIELPPDVVAQIFPGADLPSYPVDTLVSFDGALRPEPPPDQALPGTMVICRAAPGTMFNGTPLPFTLGLVLPSHGAAQRDSILVAWWVPGLSPQANFKPGRKKHVVDIFSAWRPLDSLRLDEAKDSVMPPVIVPKGDIVELNVDLDCDKIPYPCFDKLSATGIDVTGLNLSTTPGGNIYRSYILMGGGGGAS